MSKISNYEELMAERRRLEATITEQKAVINDGISKLKEKVEPFLYLLPVLNVFKKTDSGGSLLKSVASIGIDLLVGQKLLSKSNWLIRLIVPMFLKKVSGKAIDGKNEQQSVNRL